MIGIELKATAIRAVKLKKKKKGIKITDFFEVPLKPETFVNGQPVDTDEIIDALIDIKEEFKIKEPVYINISDFISKIGTLPTEYTSDYLAAKEDISPKITALNQTDDMCIDCALYIPNGAKTKLNVVYAAALYDDIEIYMDLFKAANLKIASIEPECFALIRYFSDCIGENKLIINVDQTYTSLITYNPMTGIKITAFTVGFRELSQMAYIDDFIREIKIHMEMPAQSSIIFTNPNIIMTGYQLPQPIYAEIISQIGIEPFTSFYKNPNILTDLDDGDVSLLTIPIGLALKPFYKERSSIHGNSQLQSATGSSSAGTDLQREKEQGKSPFSIIHRLFNS